MYSGEVARWKGFVSMVQARVNLRLAKRSGNYQPVLDALSNGGLVEDARLAYGSTSTAMDLGINIMNKEMILL